MDMVKDAEIFRYTENPIDWNCFFKVQRPNNILNYRFRSPFDKSLKKTVSILFKLFN